MKVKLHWESLFAGYLLDGIIQSLVVCLQISNEKSTGTLSVYIAFMKQPYQIA
jgi:hypothetical protein